MALKRLATKALIIGAALSAPMHSAKLNMPVKTTITEHSQYKVPDGWKCTNTECKRDLKEKSKVINEFTYEPKIQSQEYQFGKKANELQMINLLRLAKSQQTKFELLSGFSFRFFVADEFGGHFNISLMEKLIKNSDLKKQIKKYMLNYPKPRSYRKIISEE